MQGTQNAVEVEFGTGRTESFVREVVEELKPELSETLATDIEVVGQTIKVHKDVSDVEDWSRMWDTYKAAFDVLHDWGYSLDSDKSSDELDVFRLVR